MGSAPPAGATLKVRRVVATLSALSLLATGCTLSRLDQAAAVTVAGRLLGPEGSPRAQAQVLLFKEADVLDAVLGVALLTGSLGTICLVDDPPTLCGRARRATTDANGRFTFEMRGRDTQGSAGTAATFHLAAAMPPGDGEARGPSITARFTVQTTDLEVPELRLWRPRLELASGRDRFRVEWDALGGGPASQRVVFFSAPAGAMVWAAEGSSPLAIDGRVLEDARGTAAVEATTTERGDDTTFRITRRSGQRSYSGSAGAPPSRGAPCVGIAEPEGSEPAPLSPCAVTDGDLASPGRSPASGPVTTIVVDLGNPRSVDLVVVRGCPATCEIETSNDGRTWTSVDHDRSQPFLAVDPPAGTRARALRVRSVADVGRLSEVSVW